MTVPSDPLLRITDLSITARTGMRENRIVEGVSFELHKGRVLGLVGESGAGKSTLGMAAMGYLRPGFKVTSGAIDFAGVDLVRADAAMLRDLRGIRIAYVAQSAAASFNPTMRLLPQCIEAPVQHGKTTAREARTISLELYSLMGLPAGISMRFPHQVSGGQLQRAMTAMAMTARPELIIFDEPTTALDVTTQVDVLAAIRGAVRHTGVAALYISHDLAVVAQMADDLLVLQGGKAVEYGGAGDLMRQPRQAYTKTLLAVRGYRSPPKEPSPASPVLDIRNVTFGYGAMKVLDDVSLSVPPGRTVAVVGESGSGKSTVARAIAGLIKPWSGHVFLAGKELKPVLSLRSRLELRSIQMIYQAADTALNPRQRIGDIIGRPLEFYLGYKGRKRDDRVKEILSRIGLEPSAFLDRLPGELSGGQKQRIGIARALAAEPRLLICDEVTSALDQLVAESILKLLDDIQRATGLSYLFITHDLTCVRAIADEVIVMERGRIVEARPKDALFAEPQHPYTRRLLAAVPEASPQWLTGVLAKRSRADETAMAEVS
jgi:peptide/nickel transport system ATP-binding protein